MARLLTAARDLFLPRSCVGCRAPGTWWCPQCAASCPPVGSAVTVAPGLATVAAVPYAGAARDAILAHKNGQVRALRPVLAQWLATALDLLAAGPDVVLVPMPATRRSRRARGFDPVAEIAAAAAAGRAVVPALRWARQPRAQKELTRSERADNVHGRMAGTWLPARAVLVDDVVTTGATFVEARRALIASGTEVAGAAAMCYTR